MSDSKTAIYHCTECAGKEDPCVLIFNQESALDIPESCPMIEKKSGTANWELMNPKDT